MGKQKQENSAKFKKKKFKLLEICIHNKQELQVAEILY